MLFDKKLTIPTDYRTSEISSNELEYEVQEAAYHLDQTEKALQEVNYHYRKFLKHKENALREELYG